MSKSRDERRAAARWNPALPVRAWIEHDERKRDVDVKDVSASGARLELVRDGAHDLKAGEPIVLELRSGDRPWSIPSVISWANGGENGTLAVGIEYGGNVDGVPGSLDVRRVAIDPTWALRVPAGLALRRRVLPLCLVDGRVQVACADPSDAAALSALARYITEPLEALQADPESLAAELRRIYGGTGMVVEDTKDDAVSIVDELLRAAWMRRASDVHIDPEHDSVRVRLRVDGRLEEYKRLPTRAHVEVLARIKVIAGLDIAEKRAPQDGRFTHDIGTLARFEVRVATLPTKHGERATLRLLALSGISLDLTSLGMSPKDLATFEAAIRRPHGLVLATGPTGCGKTTTLQSALVRILELRPANAIAVQDPVEYDIPGVAQVEVDQAQKITFAKALRSILRHDPDVILVGEIRDAETVDVAIKAALTGHLVLATLHTNTAASAVTRLVDMGADRFLIAAVLRLVVAQRLARRLCSACRRPATLATEAARALARPTAAGGAAFEPKGCVACAGRGYGGRIGLFELLPIDETLGEAIARGADERELSRTGRTTGATMIVDDALEKIGRGVVSVADVLEAVAI